MKKTGDQGEIIAIEYLKKHGYTLLQTNYKYSTIGEIDIICFKDDLTIFVEVKYRTNQLFGGVGESITKTKMRKLLTTIHAYCYQNRVDFEKIRFDIITIEKQVKSFRLTHYKNQSFS